MKATETVVDIVSKKKFSVKFSVKMLPANMGFLKYSGLKFSLHFQNAQTQALKKGILWKKLFLNISRTSQDNTCVGVSF